MAEGRITFASLTEVDYTKIGSEKESAGGKEVAPAFLLRTFVIASDFERKGVLWAGKEDGGGG